MGTGKAIGKAQSKQFIIPVAPLAEVRIDQWRWLYSHSNEHGCVIGCEECTRYLEAQAAYAVDGDEATERILFKVFD